MTEPIVSGPLWSPDVRRFALGACVTALLAAVAAGAPLPASVRITSAVLALVLWPGAMLLRFLLADPEIEWPGRIAYAFALGLLPAGLLALGSHFLRFDAGVGLWLLPLLGFLLASVEPPRPPVPAHPRGLLPWAILAGWVVVVGIVIGGLGAPLLLDSDSLDHIATVRRIETVRETFPTDAFFADAGPTGADPRKGTYHAVLALVARAAHVDPVTLWRFLPLLFVPLFLLAMDAFTFALTGSRMAGLIAAILFPLVYGGGPGGTELREAVYSTRVGEMVALLAVAALMRYVEHGGSRRLALFWVTALSSLFVHVWYALYFAIALGAYALCALVFVRRKVDRRRIPLALGGLAVVALPYLLFRALQAYGPQNPIHTEPQGLLYLTPRLFTIDPQAMWTWHGAWLVVALCAVPWFWSRRKTSAGALYLAVVTPFVLLLMLNPLLTPLLHDKLGYLVMRFIWIAPVIPAVATVLTRLGEVVVRERGRRRAWAGAGLVLAALLVAPALEQAISLLTERGALRAAEAKRSAAPWNDVLEFLAARPDLAVLASDPVTSYSIPAYTGRQVMAFFDQHSSPNDPRGLTRILDARAVLSPYVGLRRTLEILRAYGVDAVVLNARFDRPVATDYWSTRPADEAATRAKFEARPDLFQQVFAQEHAYVYALTAEARTGPLPAPDDPPPPFAHAADAAGDAPLRDGAFAQHGTTLSRDRLAPGDTLGVATRWSLADGPVAPGSYSVIVRLDADSLPQPPFGAAAFDKPWRKALERATGRRWRLREAHRPLGGVFAPDLWTPGLVVRDSTALALPANLVPGTYDVRVRMIREPHYPNTSVRDYLHDDDSFSGPVVGRVTIAERGR